MSSLAMAAPQPLRIAGVDPPGEPVEDLRRRLGRGRQSNEHQRVNLRDLARGDQPGREQRPHVRADQHQRTHHGRHAKHL